jgi:hypothetical protein
LAARAWVVLVNVVLAVCLLEGALRAQQRLGPIYDLSIGPETIMVGISEELNHAQEPGPDWDPNGLYSMPEPNAAQCAPRVLFMGDSFMQGLGTAENVPYHVRRFFREAFGKDVCVFNAGQSSYSPSIFVPQAKKLIPVLQPDFVVIDVDETDLFDDYHRYRALVRRDEAGSIVAVRPTPISLQFHRGLVESTAKMLYLHRLLAKLYFTRVVYPRLFDEYYRTKPADMFWASRLPEAEARERYGPALLYFDQTLEDLTRTVLSRMGGPDGLIYVHHPHLEHLGAGADTFNDVVSVTLRHVAGRHNVRYLDAKEIMRTQFGAHPERYYIPNDMHFNKLGLRAYAVDVAKYLRVVFGDK